MKLPRARHIAAVLVVAGLVTAGVVVVRRLRARARFVVYPAAEVAGVRNPHAYRGRPLCQACHPHRDERLADDPVRLCTRCHTFDHTRSHPVDVVQRDAQDVKLPLGAGGRVLCHTCHADHDLGQFKHGLRLPFSDLCLQCHRGH